MSFRALITGEADSSPRSDNISYYTKTDPQKREYQPSHQALGIKCNKYISKNVEISF